MSSQEPHQEFCHYCRTFMPHERVGTKEVVRGEDWVGEICTIKKTIVRCCVCENS